MALVSFRDVLNTPFYSTRKEGDPTVNIAGGYAPIPSHDKDGGSTTYRWPLVGSQGYYSEMYSGCTRCKTMYCVPAGFWCSFVRGL